MRSRRRSKGDEGNVRLLQHDADDPANVTVPDYNDMIMDRLAQRFEGQVGFCLCLEAVNQFVSEIDQNGRKNKRERDPR